VKALLDHGARVDITDSDGTGLVYLAVEDYDPQILRLILQHRGNVDPHTSKNASALLDWGFPPTGRTPLMMASGWGEDEEIDLLLGAGADIDAQDLDGRTALMYAIGKGRPENIACLLAHHPNLHLKDTNGNTSLSEARACRETNTITPFNHDADTDFWPNIVTMLEQADK